MSECYYCELGARRQPKGRQIRTDNVTANGNPSDLPQTKGEDVICFFSIVFYGMLYKYRLYHHCMSELASRAKKMICSILTLQKKYKRSGHEVS